MILKTDRGETWKPIDLGDAGDIEVLVRRPTWDDLCADTERLSGYVEHRLTTAIVGWRGVRDEEGQIVPFSVDALKSACRNCPALFGALIQLANAAYRGLESETEKNSAAPPVEDSTDAAKRIEQSNAGPDCGD